MSFHIDDLTIFARVAALGSLSAVARERNTPVSQVTRALARLETVCGARLMHRTTHGLSLTDEGDKLLKQGQVILDASEVVMADLQARKSTPSGWVRLAVSSSVAESVVVPALPALYEKHPHIHLEVLTDDRLSDMARDGIDIAIRTAEVHSETMVARALGTTRRGLYASPAYLARHGTPRHPKDLDQHHLIGNSRAGSMNQWQRRDIESSFTVKGSTLTDNSALLQSMVLQGVGIARLLEVFASPFVKKGELVPLLGEYFDVEEVPLYAVMLQTRYRLPKIRACVDFFSDWLKNT